MKKITLLISSIILFFFINGCAGYEPIFSSTNLQFEIADYSIKGDKTLGGKIYSKLHDISKNNKNNQDAKNIELFINVTKTKDSTSKDTSGKILEYKITLNVEVEIQDFCKTFACKKRAFFHKNFNIKTRVITSVLI